MFYLAAFASLAARGESWEFYQRKRSEGRKHNQAIICLARRLVDVVWALIRDEREFAPPTGDLGGERRGVIGALRSPPLSG